MPGLGAQLQNLSRKNIYKYSNKYLNTYLRVDRNIQVHEVLDDLVIGDELGAAELLLDGAELVGELLCCEGSHPGPDMSEMFDNITMTLTCPRVDAAGSQLGGHRQQLSPLYCRQTGKTARDTKVVLFVVANQEAMHPQDFLNLMISIQ